MRLREKVSYLEAENTLLNSKLTTAETNLNNANARIVELEAELDAANA